MAHSSKESVSENDRVHLGASTPNSVFALESTIISTDSSINLQVVVVTQPGAKEQDGTFNDKFSCNAS